MFQRKSGGETDPLQFAGEFEAELAGLVIRQPFRHSREDEPSDCVGFIAVFHLQFRESAAGFGSELYRAARKGQSNR